MSSLLAFSVTAFALFGLLLGSFANVVIWRVPRGESVVTPPSHCPSCGERIRWYDNVPLVSWMLLGGRCRACGEAIAGRYFLVEVASGVLFALAVLAFGPTWKAAAAAVFFWFLLVLSVIDIDHYRLPNALVAVLAAVGAAGALVSQMSAVPLVPVLGPSGGTGLMFQPLANALFGMVVGAGLSGGIAAAYGAVRRTRGLGMGDVKFLGALGIFLGPYVLVALFLGSVMAAIGGLAFNRGTRLADRRIPFGPFLAVSAAVTALGGPRLMAWYLELIGVM
ncbi:MAG: prepilin peptidase [Coriobacteriia bacterium]